MAEKRVIEVKEKILARNDAKAETLREKLRAQGVFFVNLMASPGAGKTTLLAKTVEALRGGFVESVGVIEADLDSDVDARTMEQAGANAVQVHTGGMCHLSVEGAAEGLARFGEDLPELVFLENVGGLVCTAEFDIGAMKNVVLLSIPEGDDKPLKYPFIFEIADAVIIGKTDALPVFDDFDKERVTSNIRLHNKNCPIFFLSAKTGEGMDAWTDWLSAEMRNESDNRKGR